MTKTTKLLLNWLQKTHLDYPTLILLNNKIINHFLLAYGWQIQDAASFELQFKDWEEKLKQAGINLTNKNVLEVGAGGSVGVGYFFLNKGVSKWVASDVFHSLKDDQRLIKRESKLISNLKAKFIPNINQWVKVNRRQLEFSSQVDFVKQDLVTFKPEWESQFGAVVSSAVFEHVEKEKVQTAIANLARYLEPGGYLIHDIDLRDHINVSQPFHFYRYSNAVWDKLTKGTIFYTNRLRASDFASFFQSVGLTEVMSIKENKQQLANSLLAPDFKLYQESDLLTTRLFTIWQKTHHV